MMEAARVCNNVPEWQELKERGDSLYKNRDCAAAGAAYSSSIDAAGFQDESHAVLFSNRAAAYARPHDVAKVYMSH